MFKPLLQKHEGQPHVDAAQPCEPRNSGVPETEQAAEAQAASAQEDETATRTLSWRDEAGGVDAGDVLHSVRCVEVHACVEADLCPSALSLSHDPALAQAPHRRSLTSRS